MCARCDNDALPRLRWRVPIAFEGAEERYVRQRLKSSANGGPNVTAGALTRNGDAASHPCNAELALCGSASQSWRPAHCERGWSTREARELASDRTLAPDPCRVVRRADLYQRRARKRAPELGLYWRAARPLTICLAAERQSRSSRQSPALQSFLIECTRPVHPVPRR
jgi:hypothetical protein